jgi:hypothetical protein
MMVGVSVPWEGDWYGEDSDTVASRRRTPVEEDAASERWLGLEILLRCTDFSMARERGCHNPRSLWERLLETEIVWRVAMSIAEGIVAASSGLMAASPAAPTDGGTPMSSQPGLPHTAKAAVRLDARSSHCGILWTLPLWPLVVSAVYCSATASLYRGWWGAETGSGLRVILEQRRRHGVPLALLHCGWLLG